MNSLLPATTLKTFRKSQVELGVEFAPSGAQKIVLPMDVGKSMEFARLAIQREGYSTVQTGNTKLICLKRQPVGNSALVVDLELLSLGQTELSIYSYPQDVEMPRLQGM